MPLAITLSTDPERPGTLLVSSEGLDGGTKADRTKDQTAADEEGAAEISLIEDLSLTIINDSQTLALLAAQMATPDTLIALTAPTNQRFNLAKTSIKLLRIGLLPSIDPFLTFSEREQVGEAGPITEPLVQSWREAYRAIPRRHAIEKVQWDVHHPPAIQLGNLIQRFIQEVSTGLYIKAKVEMGREMMFGVVGWESVRQKRNLTKGLPGKKIMLG